MTKSSRAGFTLIELLVVIGIIGLLAVTLLPDIFKAQLSVNIDADQAQMRKHYAWLIGYENAFKHYPLEGGHKFILDLWVKGQIQKTPQNLQFFFNPALRKSSERFQTLVKTEDMNTVWPDLRSVSTEDTDYACRAKEFLRGCMPNGLEAIMANDNEGGMWAFEDGTVNVLYGDGVPRKLTYEEHLKERCGLGPFDPTKPMQTWGKSSPHPDLQKLDN